MGMHKLEKQGNTLMGRSSFIQQIIDAAKVKQGKIVLPEGSDERVLEAANTINREKIASITLLGDEQQIADWFAGKGYDLDGITVTNPETSEKSFAYANAFYELRKAKGITEEQALEAVKQVNYFGMMIMHAGEAAGLVSGAAHSTADTVRPALQIIKSAKKGSTVSSFFIMDVDNKPYIFSDCALVENPTAEQLASIAVDSALSAMSYNIPPHVALLSYSTRGSGKGEMVDKVAQATEPRATGTAAQAVRQAQRRSSRSQVAAAAPSTAPLLSEHQSNTELTRPGTQDW